MRYGILFVILGFTVTFTGCTTLYVPSPNQTHMMKEQGEIHFNLNGGAHGGNLQAAYALTDQYGIVASISGRKSDGNNGSVDEEHNYGEIGINYFGFGTDRVSGEFTTGLGFGEGERGTSSGEYIKPFIQMNAAFTSGMFDTGVSLRTAYVSFTELNVTNDRPGDSSVFFEPAVFARMGFRNIKLESQLGIAYPLSDSGQFAFGYEPIRMSVGLKFLFNTR